MVDLIEDLNGMVWYGIHTLCCPMDAYPILLYFCAPFRPTRLPQLGRLGDHTRWQTLPPPPSPLGRF